MKDIAIYGAGGFGREIACLLDIINRDDRCWNFVGFFDDGLEVGYDNGYGKILGGIEEVNIYSKPLSLVMAIGSSVVLKSLISKITNSFIDFPNIIAPDLLVFNRSKFHIGKGNVITSRCSISCDVTIGDFNIFNGYISVGHDVYIGSFNTIMPNVMISGEVTIGDCNFLGVTSVVIQRVKIGNEVRVGSSSVIIRNTQDGMLYFGNPAVKMKLD